MSDAADLKTAPDYWNQQWTEAAGRADWSTPEPFVLEQAGAPRHVLDLGCGVGRHALALAQAGASVVGFDAAPAGLTHLAEKADAAGLPIETARGDMTDLPFADRAFDVVVSWNVIYHGGPNEVRTAIAEIERTLVPGGRFVGTMLSKRNRHFGVGVEVEPDTWVSDSGEADKDHPHFYCTAAELLALFDGFEALALIDVEHKGAGSEHWHWHVALEKRA